MIDRRVFGMGLGALGLGLAQHSSAQGAPTVFKLANTIGVLDPQMAVITVGLNPRLNYYRQEGVDIEIINMSNMTQAMQALMTGQAQFAPIATGLMLPAMAKDPSIDLISVYEWLPRSVMQIIVKPDSPIRTAGELAGKRIGVRNQGDPGIPVTKVILAELGLKDDGCDYIGIGDGATAFSAIDTGRVDAMVTFDTAAARVELAGSKLRYVPITPKLASYGSGWFAVSDKVLKEQHKQLVSLFRGIAKSTLFSFTNFDAAISLHWEIFPESRPKGKSEEEARKDLNFIMKDRKNNWMRRPEDPDQRFGASTLEEWKFNIATAADSSKNPKLPQELGDPARFYTNELIPEVNQFDRAAVIRQAREFKG